MTAFFFIFVAGAAHAAKSIGLVIGNDNYAHVPILEKARNDATAVSQALTKVDFDVTRVLDADRSEMNRAISTFVAKLQPGDTAFIFFAGHGVEIAGQNYLLPVDIDATANASEDFIKSESIGLSNVLARVQSTGARITLMFIDACRDNPFKIAAGRSIGGSRGLARITAPEGTFVVFSAGAGQQALDRLKGPDDNPNSVFTRTLLPRLADKGLELRDMISKVRLEVREIALSQNHRQFPAYYDELLGEFFFKPGDRKPTPTETSKSTENETSDANGRIQADFDRVRTLNSALAYQAFLEKYDGKSDILVDIARQRLANLQSVAEDQNAVLPKVSGPKPEKVQPTKDLSEEHENAKRRNIIRASQKRLNALGCSVGVADGIPGPRTHRAYQEFLSKTGSGLSRSDIGSQAALDQLSSASGTICSVVAPKRQTAKQKVETQEAPVKIAKGDTQSSAVQLPQPVSLAGVWTFRARCPLAIRARGTTTYRSLGGNRYSVVTTDNFNNLGKGTAVDIGGGIIAVRLVWQDGANDNYNARLSGDRREISGKNYAGCRFTARKQD